MSFVVEEMTFLLSLMILFPGKPHCCGEYKYLKELDSLPNGDYSLYPGTPRTVPVTMYCHNDASMETRFKEFVNFRSGSMNRNWYTSIDFSKVVTHETKFSKIRLNITVGISKFIIYSHSFILTYEFQ